MEDLLDLPGEPTTPKTKERASNTIEDLLETIRGAIADDASDDAKARGAVACRAILARLEPPPATPSDASRPPNPSPAETLASVVGMLRGVPPEQLLDFAITRLRAALPTDGLAPPPAGTGAPASPVRFQMVPLPHARAKASR